MWRSLVAQQLWELMVAGSNPVIPIYPCDVNGKHHRIRIGVFCRFESCQGYLADNQFLLPWRNR
jgi:hypothetical protein